MPVQPPASQYFSSIDHGMSDASSMMSSLGSSSSRLSGQHQFQDTFPGSHHICRTCNRQETGPVQLSVWRCETPAVNVPLVSVLFCVLTSRPPRVFQVHTPSSQKTPCHRRTRGKGRGRGRCSPTCREKDWRRDSRYRNMSPSQTESSWLRCSG